MVAITVALLGGFGVVVLTTVGQDTADPPASSFTMEPTLGAATLDVRLVSGSAVELAASTITFAVGGTDRLGSYAVVGPKTAGTWATGETLRVTLSSGTLSAGADLLFFAADKESGKAIGMAYATVPAATSGTAILQNAMSLALAFDRPRLVTDGVSVVNATLTVQATHGLLLVDHASLDLSPVGGVSDLRLYDDGVFPDALAGDGAFTAPFTVDNHTYGQLPGLDNITLRASVVDVVGKTATTTGVLAIASPAPSKVGAGVVYRDIGSSGEVGSAGYINLTAFSFRDVAALDSDQVELRISDMTDSSQVWSALVSFADSGACGSPGVTSIVLRRDGVAGNATYTPTDGCFEIDVDAKLNLANVVTSRDAGGDLASWTAVASSGTEASYQYAAAGIGADNEALIAFFGDTISTSPFARGLSQTDFSWAPPVEAGAASAPSAITTLAGTAGNGYVDLAWSAPGDGGSALTGYGIYVDGALAATIGTNATFRVNSLTNGVSYDFTVRAINAVGTAVDSNVVTRTPVSTPSEPTSFAAVKGNGTVALSWTAPVSTGGSAITSYHIYVGTSSTTAYLAATGSGANTSFTVNGLTNGVEYSFNVTASNANGQGASTAIAVATPSTIPNPPGALDATAGNAQVALSWTPGANGGSALTTYDVRRGLASGITTLLASTGSGANTTYVDATAINGITYYYTVVARNVNGASVASNEDSATPASAGSAPSAPRFATASPANEQIGLNWTAPLTDGGSTLTGYKIYRGTTSGSSTLLATLSTTNVTYVDLTAANGITYTYVVKATNAVGDSPDSNEATAAANAAVSFDCSSLSASSGSISSCASIQYADLVYGTLDESGGGSAKTINMVFSMNLTGVTGTQTLELNGYNSKNGEALLLQARDAGGAYVTIATLGATVSTSTTVSGVVDAATYWPTGVLQIRVIDNGADPPSTRWKVDFVRMVTT